MSLKKSYSSSFGIFWSKQSNCIGSGQWPEYCINTTKGLAKITPAIGKIIDLGEKHWNFVVLVFWKEKNQTGTMARILHLKIP